jgi:PAS domain S-box-containing protein
MTLSTRLTIAMVGLVIGTAVAVGWLTYRNLAAVILPRALERTEPRVRLLAMELADYVQGARSDILGFRSAVALSGIVRARLAGGVDPLDGTTETVWRERMAARYAAELASKPAYFDFRYISFDDGREIVRVDRSGPDGGIRIVPGQQLKIKSDQKFFQATAGLPFDRVYVSPVELSQGNGVMANRHVPILRVAALVMSQDQKSACFVIIKIDMRPIFNEIRSAARAGSQVYVVDDLGEYLVHPDPAREFGSELGKATRWQDDFPALAAAFDADEPIAQFISDPAGGSAAAGLASVLLAGGPRVAVIETTSNAVIMAPAAAIGDSILLVGLVAVLCAGGLAVIIARSLTRPLVQMRHAVEGFARDQSIDVPTSGGEIGVLARAFARMAAEVKEKTASLERAAEQRRRTETTLEGHAERERLYGAAVQSSVDAIVTTTLDGIVTGWNPAAERLFGWVPDAMIGRSIDVIVPEDRRTEVRTILRKVSRDESLQHHETVRIDKNGKRIDISLSVSPVKSPSGVIVGACKIARDIGESKRAKETLLESEAAARHNAELLDKVIASITDALLVVDEDGRLLYVNRVTRDLFGESAVIGSDAWQRSFQLLDPEGVRLLPREEWPISRSIRGEAVDNVPLMLRSMNGDWTRQSIVSGRPLRDDAGALKGAVLVSRDVTLARETERQLRQSQKMDAIGQLTGGVAHDFNNILTVITGTIEILADAVADRPQLAAIARMIDDAAQRGAELTQRLLAFARKQPLQPRATDVNALVVEAAGLLRPTLGEQVEIEAVLKDDVWPALVDPSQLTTALLNLAFNARDAMPKGGQIMLETRNVDLDESYAAMHGEVTAGPYVMLAVSDSGIGMPAAVRDRIFEPFFTTKEAGKGTGLGLSMVYGFIKQSGGHIKVYSEDGHGTTIKIYLPRAAEYALPRIDAPACVEIEGGRETILIVEDDALVRNYVAVQLESLGYRTLAAGNAADGLALIDRGETLDLLFSDVIMPGSMNGRQLADEARRRRPSLGVLFTSGYTEDAVIHHGRLDPGVLLLAKPYRKSDLARMIRQALRTAGKAA